MSFSPATLVRPWWARILWVLASLAVIAPGIAIMMPASDPFAQQATLYVVLLAVSLSIERARGGGHTTFGLAAHRHVPFDLTRGALYAVGSIAVVAAVALMLGGRFTLASVEWTSSALWSLVFVVVMAGGEEVLFRGIIFQSIEERFGGVTAVLITSVPFGLAHATNPNASAISVANTILAGVVLGVMAWHGRSLWMAISFHVAWNVTLAMCIGPLSGLDDLPFVLTKLDTTALGDIRWLVDGTYGIEQGLVTTVLLIASAYGVLRSQRYDAVVAAARMRRTMLEAARRYTPASVSSSPQQATTQDH